MKSHDDRRIFFLVVFLYGPRSWVQKRPTGPRAFRPPREKCTQICGLRNTNKQNALFVEPRGIRVSGPKARRSILRPSPPTWLLSDSRRKRRKKEIRQLLRRLFVGLCVHKIYCPSEDPVRFDGLVHVSGVEIG